MTRDDQFSAVTNLILGYETGDFLLLSDLSDALSGLKDFFLDIPEAVSLIDKILKCVTDEMKQSGNAAFIETISSGIDLLQKHAAAQDDQTRSEILHSMNEYGCGKASASAAMGSEEGVQDRDDETFQIFLAEVKDRLDTAQETVLKLEEEPEDLGSIQNLFRVFHTIKGECGFLKIATLGELTHNIENILDELRNGKSSVSRNIIDLLLEGIDMSREIVSRLEKNDFILFNDVSLESYVNRLKEISRAQCSNLGKILVETGKLQSEDVDRILQKQKATAFSKRFGEIAVQENYLSSEELHEVLAKQRECKSGEAPKAAERSDPIIKVHTSKVNFLVDMIGELLIAMGQVNCTGPEFMQIKKITRSLQLGAMELRTDSLHSLFGNVKRAIRDLSKQLGKSVRAVCVGEDLEIDRNLIEKLEEPLLHLVRNSLDHGLENEGDRAKLGKDPQGTVSLKAERHGNSIVISVRDDGLGLDRKKILVKAVEKGLIKAEVRETLTDMQVFNFIFASGFSTNDSVSLISGRGVGMDIVRSVVTENRGRIEVESSFGEFTEFRLVFPLSTAIIDGMITRVSDSLFVFPIGSVIESIKILKGMISSINGKVEVANLRGESIPVIRMHDVFGIAETSGNAACIGVVCETSDRRKFMFILDEVIAKREVVIKSLGAKFAGLRGVSSGTVLAGGRIGLVVDIDEIVSLSLLELDA